MRTQNDDCETPREIAEKAGLRDFARLLALCEARDEKQRQR
jgi:hypothetical protein